MNESLEELAGLYVLDQLDRGERAAFEARLLRESELAALVRNLEAGLAHGVRALPRHEPPAGTLDRIEGRIDALPAMAAGSKSSPPPFRWVAFARWGLAAVIAVSLATIAVQNLRRSAAPPMIVVVGLEANQSTFTELPLQDSAKDSDARFMQLASLAQGFWEKPGDLPGKAAALPGDSRGYAVFDPGSQQGFIAIERLPALTVKQCYHLWVADAVTGRVRDAGILPLAGLNRGLYSFTTGLAGGPKSTRPRFFITVEENGTNDRPVQPHGKVVLGDQRI